MCVCVYLCVSLRELRLSSNQDGSARVKCGGSGWFGTPGLYWNDQPGCTEADEIYAQCGVQREGGIKQHTFRTLPIPTPSSSSSLWVYSWIQDNLITKKSMQRRILLTHPLAFYLSIVLSIVHSSIYLPFYPPFPAENSLQIRSKQYNITSSIFLHSFTFLYI